MFRLENVNRRKWKVGIRVMQFWFMPSKPHQSPIWDNKHLVIINSVRENNGKEDEKRSSLIWLFEGNKNVFVGLFKVVGYKGTVIEKAGHCDAMQDALSAIELATFCFRPDRDATSLMALVLTDLKLIFKQSDREENYSFWLSFFCVLHVFIVWSCLHLIKAGARQTFVFELASVCTCIFTVNSIALFCD